jgi:hypothetical protein
MLVYYVDSRASKWYIAAMLAGRYKLEVSVHADCLKIMGLAPSAHESVTQTIIQLGKQADAYFNV